MKLSVRFRNKKISSQIMEHIEHRCSFAFARSNRNIERLSISLIDVSGRQGVEDIKCRVVVKASGFGRFVINERRKNAREAIDRCLERASQCLMRKIKRKQALLKGRTPVDNVYWAISA